MLEAYAFLAAFTVQILAMSVLYPARFSRYVRVQAASLPAERLAQLYPGVDLELARERFLTRYRAVNMGVAVLGLLLLGWWFGYLRRPDWDEDPVVALLCGYFIMQMLPLGFVIWLGFMFNKAHKHALLEGKRKATLQRRGLLDFISPVTVLLAASSYLLFVAFVLHVQSKPFPGLPLIGVLTLVYALQALVVYKALYGKKANPLEKHSGRVHTMGLTVKVSVYSCIACTAFFSVIFTLDLMDLQRWEPLALSVFFAITALLCLMGLAAPPREPEMDELRSSPVP